MQCNIDYETEAIGSKLRNLIKQNKENTGRTYRHLSNAIGMDDNYVASYLSAPVNKWTIPKHPTLERLLLELGVQMNDLYSQSSPKNGETT